MRWGDGGWRNARGPKEEVGDEGWGTKGELGSVRTAHGMTPFTCSMAASFTTAGLSSTSSFTSRISPATGAYTSDAAFTDSTEPKVSLGGV